MATAAALGHVHERRRSVRRLHPPELAEAVRGAGGGRHELGDGEGGGGGGGEDRGGTCGKDGEEGGEGRSRWRTEKEERQRKAAAESGTQIGPRAESSGGEEGEEQRQ